MQTNRRTFLAMLGAILADPMAAVAGDGLSFGPPKPFSFGNLVEKAKSVSKQAYSAPVVLSPQILDKLGYDEHSEIRQPRSRAIFAERSETPITFFHLGNLFRKPVRMHAWVDGVAREIIYSKELFVFPQSSPANDMPDGAGFAGFRVLVDKDPKKVDLPEYDWCAFLGASYFRCAGDLNKYGVSVRGIAIDTVSPNKDIKEKFPDFVAFWIEPFIGGSGRVMALLDGPSVTGAFLFSISKYPTVIVDVDCVLFPRRQVERFGVGVPTSMFWYGKLNRWEGFDSRPEVHDSDGLLLQTGTGEFIWRPINNPPRIMVNAFQDENPKGYGLLQRERRFEAYTDEVGFERRPNAWIETKGNWGKGSVQLVEIPTSGEFLDNIVCMWVPNTPPKPRDELRFAYRIHWSVKDPPGATLARCIGTRLNKAFRIPVNDRKPGEPTLVRQIIVEFEGEALETCDPRKAEAVLSVSRGFAEKTEVWPQANGSLRQWRTICVLHADGDEPVDLRLFLREGKETLTETWVYQLHPSQFIY
jgi:glucans biosynthesis protein